MNDSFGTLLIIFYPFLGYAEDGSHLIIET
jgi:hypothetical protein